MIPSNVRKVGKYSLLTYFQPDVQQLLNYFRIFSLQSCIFFLFSLIFYLIYSTKSLNSIWNLIGNLLQKEKMSQPKSKIYKLFHYLGCFFFFALFLNLLHIDMVVNILNKPVNKLENLAKLDQFLTRTKVSGGFCMKNMRRKTVFTVN